VTSKAHARRLGAAVHRALQRRECQRWRDLHHPLSHHWADGPCLRVALAIAQADDYRGRVQEVSAGAHAVYVLAGVAIDGHGVYNLTRRLNCAEKPRPIGYHHQREVERRGKGFWALDWHLEGVRAPFTLVRAIRKELRKTGP